MSHNKISANCEFPKDLPSEMVFLPDTLSSVLEDWMRKVRDYAEGLWQESYPNIIDTQPMPSQPIQWVGGI